MSSLALLLVALLFQVVLAPVRAGRDVPVPERISYVPPEYPPIALFAFPPALGIVALDVELNEEGRPVAIKVLRGAPLINEAAIKAARQWRYRPTLVDGSPQRVALVEVVDFFPDERSRADYFARMLKDSKEAKSYRLLAIERLKAMGVRRKPVLSALEKAAEDPDQDIKNASAEALKALMEAGK
jgi:hypothetical protein